MILNTKKGKIVRFTRARGREPAEKRLWYGNETKKRKEEEILLSKLQFLKIWAI